MLTSTFQILGESPAAFPGLLISALLIAAIVKRFQTILMGLARKAVIVALVPLFGVVFLAEFTDDRFWERMATHLVELEAALLHLLIDFVDAVFAAGLKLYLKVVSGNAVLTESLDAAVPDLTGGEFLLSVFVFNAFAGAALVAGLYSATRKKGVNSVLQAFGVVMLISGLFSTVLWLDIWTVSEQVLVYGLVVTTLGLGAGISVMLLGVKPDFSGGAALSRLQDADLWTQEPAEQLSIRGRVYRFFTQDEE